MTALSDARDYISELELRESAAEAHAVEAVARAERAEQERDEEAANARNEAAWHERADEERDAAVARAERAEQEALAWQGLCNREAARVGVLEEALREARRQLLWANQYPAVHNVDAALAAAAAAPPEEVSELGVCPSEAPASTESLSGRPSSLTSPAAAPPESCSECGMSGGEHKFSCSQREGKGLRWGVTSPAAAPPSETPE